MDYFLNTDGIKNVDFVLGPEDSGKSEPAPLRLFRLLVSVLLKIKRDHDYSQHSEFEQKLPRVKKYYNCVKVTKHHLEINFLVIAVIEKHSHYIQTEKVFL